MYYINSQYMVHAICIKLSVALVAVKQVYKNARAMVAFKGILKT